MCRSSAGIRPRVIRSIFRDTSVRSVRTTYSYLETFYKYYKYIYLETVIIAIKKHPNSAYIFCDENGSQVRDITKSFSTALEKSGIKYGSPDGVTLHTLRHSFASHLVMSGIDLTTVKDLLGHREISMVLRYSHLSPGHKQHAVEALGKLIVTNPSHSGKVETQDKLYYSEVIENKLVKLFGK